MDRSSSDIARSAWPCSTSHKNHQCGIAVSIAVLSGVAPTQCRHLRRRPGYPRWLVQAPARAQKIARHSRGHPSPCMIAHGPEALRTCGQPVAGGEGYGCDDIASGTDERDKIDVARCRMMQAIVLWRRSCRKSARGQQLLCRVRRDKYTEAREQHNTKAVRKI